MPRIRLALRALRLIPGLLIALAVAGCPVADDESATGALVFPDNFIWGVAGSAYQTEGGNSNDWEREIEQVGPLSGERPGGQLL